MAGQAKIRAQRRREAREAKQSEPKYAAQVPKFETVWVQKWIIHQIRLRLPQTTLNEREFTERLLEVGLIWFGLEIDKLKTKPAEEMLKREAKATVALETTDG